MTSITKMIMYGQKPVKRCDPQPGQTEWYYLDPRGTDNFSDMKTIDVDNQYSPNPVGQEIKTYLSENDPDLYKEFYGSSVSDQKNNTVSTLANVSHLLKEDTNVFKKSSIPTTGTVYAQNNVGNIVNDVNATQLPKINYSLYGDRYSKQHIDEMLNDSKFQRALKEYVIPNEGGYVNDSKDPGGETNMGISKRYHRNEDIKNLTRERANIILYDEVWGHNGIKNLPEEISGIVLDHGTRTSPQNAVNTVHKVLNNPPKSDIIGPVTLEKLHHTDYEDFVEQYKKKVMEQDKKRDGYPIYGKGWDNRTNKYHVSY